MLSYGLYYVSLNNSEIVIYSLCIELIHRFAKHKLIGMLCFDFCLGNLRISNENGMKSGEPHAFGVGSSFRSQGLVGPPRR